MYSVIKQSTVFGRCIPIKVEEHKSSELVIFPVERIKVILCNFDVYNISSKNCKVDEILLNVFQELEIHGLPHSMFVEDIRNGDKIICSPLSMSLATQSIKFLIENLQGKNGQWYKNLFLPHEKHEIVIWYSLISEPQLMLMIEELGKELEQSDIKELVGRCKEEYVSGNNIVSDLFETIKYSLEYKYGKCSHTPIAETGIAVSMNIKGLSFHESTSLSSLVLKLSMFVMAAAVKTRDDAKVANKKKRNRERRKKRREGKRGEENKLTKNKGFGGKGDMKDETVFAAKLALLDPTQRAVEIQHILQNHDDECMVCMEKYPPNNEEDIHVWDCGHKVCNRCFKELKEERIDSCIICK